MRKLRIGMIGLGYIAQSTYLPILSQHTAVEFVGAYSPNVEDTKRICQQYRITPYTDMVALIKDVDALFVHSATSSHYEVIKTILSYKKPVYVDKPLAAELADAQELITIAETQHIPLMVGFNRRFAPAYLDLKAKLNHPSFIHVEKHRINEVGKDLAFTLLDDYIHIIDTLYWLSDGALHSGSQFFDVNAQGQLIFGQNQYQSAGSVYRASMHRQSGTSLEKITVIQDGMYMELEDMLHLKTIKNDVRTIAPINLRISAPARRGFDNAVNHFIEAVLGGTDVLVSGRDAIAAQQMISDMILEYEKNK